MSRLIHLSIRWLISALAAILPLVFLGPPAGAAEQSPISITNLEISEVPNPTEPTKPAVHLVKLVGKYSNPTSADISRLELDLVASGPIRSRSELGKVIANPAITSGKTHDGLTAVLRNVRGNQTRDFQISFIGEEIFGASASGVFQVGALPAESKYGAGSVVTTPWFYNAEVQPTNVVLAVQLTTLNTHLANGKVSNVEDEQKEAARLSQLVNVNGRESVSWLLDPSLPNWAVEISKQKGAASVSELSNQLGLLPETTNLLPVAHSDLGALLRANRDEEAQLTISMTKGSASSRSIYYAPISGFADRQSVTKLNDLGVNTLISNVAVRDAEHVTVPARVTASTNPVLVYDAATSNCLSTPTKGEDNFAQLNCLRSEIAMITAESPQLSRSIIVLAPPTWKISTENFSEIIAALTNQSWVTLSTLNSIPPTESTETVISRTDSEQRSLPKSLLKQADLLALNTETVSALFDDQELASGFTSTRLLGYSDLFATNAKATKFLNSNYNLLNKYMSSIKLEASTRITTPNEDSEIPITVVNDSDQPVSVSIDLTSSSTSRFQAKPTGIIQVDKGQRVTVPVAIKLVGAGIVDVRAQLVAPNGEHFGEVQNIQISSTAYSAFARTLVWGAFGLLTLLSISNFIKRRSARLAQKN